MPIYQLNTWVCENCGVAKTTTEITNPYSDPVVVPPNNEDWGYIIMDSKEKLCCNECLNKNRQELPDKLILTDKQGKPT